VGRAIIKTMAERKVRTMETPGSDVEAMLTVLREHGLRAEITITSELREHLACVQIRLESGFIEANPVPSLVFVRRVDLDPAPSTEPSQGVVKFSPRRFSLATCDSLQLGTPEYYRGYEGEGSGIQDEDEGVYEESLHSFFAKYNPEAVAMLGTWSQMVATGKTKLTCEVTASGSAMYQVNDGWLYCTAFHPRSQSERASMQDKFDGTCITALGEPSKFAGELGSAVAQMSPGPEVSLEEWFHQLQHEMLRSQTPFQRVVHVYHGPVVYTDHAESLIEAVPLLYRSAAVPFVKATAYAAQREYRFAVSTIGTPTATLLSVPVTPRLQSLSRIVN